MPQPIDMQTELARATMADRIQQVTDRASLAAAMRAKLDGEQHQALGETQVDDTPESQSEHVDPDLKRKNPYGRRGSRRRSRDGSDGRRDTGRAGTTGHNFDVSV